MPSNTTPYKLPSATVSGLRPFGLRFLLLGILIINLEAQPSKTSSTKFSLENFNIAQQVEVALLGAAPYNPLGAIRG